jgi:CheY-like chemotaxis protein
MARILVIHWHAGEAAGRAEQLRKAGYEADYFATSGADGGDRKIREYRPEAIIIDLTRLPSHGRAVAAHLRTQSSTRQIPVLLIEGDSEKTAVARNQLPGAVFTRWTRITTALERALSKPAAPTSAGYSGTPLAKKLRIREGSRVALIGAPEGFEAALDPLPPKVHIQSEPDDADVILAFFTAAGSLAREVPGLARHIQAGRTLWLIWPKKSSGMKSDLDHSRVQRMGLETGLVDIKVCAVDETWSGLAFAARRAKAATRS